jgi:NMD protein affecting ribosome stability and mRNA decay
MKKGVVMRRQRSETHPAARSPRRSRKIYEEKAGKLPEFSHCPNCGATYHEGRWTWDPAPSESHPHVCPACQRVEDDFPAGELHVEGEFVAGHRDDLVGLLRNVEERERKEHPLKRIMQIADAPGGLRVTTTDAKLTDALGRALHHAYKGELQHPPTTSDRENLVRIHWRRD